MLVEELIAKLQELNAPKAEVKIQADVVVDGEEDFLLATVEGVVRRRAGLVIISADGVSDEDREEIEERDREIADRLCRDDRHGGPE